MEPCTAPTLSASTAKTACGCSQATEAVPVPVIHESRAFAFEPISISGIDEEASFPSGLPVVLAAVALFAWTRQRSGARLVALHLGRPETTRERRRRDRPRLVLSERERQGLTALRAFFGRAPVPAAVPLRAGISRRA